MDWRSVTFDWNRARLSQADRQPGHARGLLRRRFHRLRGQQAGARQPLDGLNALGFSLTGRNFPVLTASHLVHWELVKQGLGVGVMPIRTGDAEPLVRRALPAMAPIELPVWLVAHRELRTSRRVRLVFDFLFDELAALPPLSSA